MSWFEQANEAPIAEVAHNLGYQVEGKTIRPCPACGAKTRGSKDKRGPVGYHPQKGWKCHRGGCQATGSAIGFAAAALTGSVKPEQWSRVRDWFAELGYCDAYNPVLRRRPEKVPPSASTGSSPPPWEEVDSLIKGLVPVTGSRAEEWLLHGVKRSISPKAVDEDRLAGYLGPVYTPEWAVCAGKPWGRGGWRVVCPLYDHDGVVRSVHARNIVETKTPKGASPKGYSISGLVFANPVAVSMLRRVSAPSDIIVVEGQPDYLTMATRRPWKAVIGIISGSWSEGLAKAIPRGANVILATDPDKAGDEYAAKIEQSLRFVTAYRKRMPDGHDVSSYFAEQDRGEP